MTAQNKKISRPRSPNYPSYSLPDCIGFLNLFYKKYKVSEAHIDDAIDQMGHSTKSSTANRVLSSMLSFGLLTPRGTGDSKFVRVSQEARELLLEPEDSIRRKALLKKIALTDSPMLAVWNKWGAHVPDKDTIKRILQLEMDYTPEGAKRFASVITKTYEFAKLDELVNERLGEEKSEDLDIGDEIASEIESDNEEKISSTSLRKANFLLPGVKREFIVSAPADLSDEEFEMVQKWLELQKYGLVSSIKKMG